VLATVAHVAADLTGGSSAAVSGARLAYVLLTAAEWEQLARDRPQLTHRLPGAEAVSAAP
jgi:hypothetical protein